ncbi:hypothetical protein REPUB_Repub15cG0044900 [Reevesia pubescens]
MTKQQLKVLNALDVARIHWYHFDVFLITRLGVFSAAYDLFCISPVTRLLGRIYYQVEGAEMPSILPRNVALAVNAVIFLGSFPGHIFFGWLGDKLGRKKAYGDDCDYEGFIDEDAAMRKATRESLQSQHEWHRRQEFRQRTGGWSNTYEEGRSSQASHGSIAGYFEEKIRKSTPSESEFSLRGAMPELVRTEVGQHVKLPTPYEISMCIWSLSINNKGTIFWKSMDVSNVRSRDAKFYYKLLDEVIEEIGEQYIVQIVTDNEVAIKATGKQLMTKRKHLYWTSCAAHCLDLCLEDIGKKQSIEKVLEEAKKVTCFIYNHIWTVDLLKKYTNGKQILHPALTRFATHFI